MRNAPDEPTTTSEDGVGAGDVASRPASVVRCGQRRWILLGGVALLAIAYATPALIDRSPASGIEAAAIQQELDRTLPAGASREAAESALADAGVRFTYNEFAHRIEGTVPESRDSNWMGVGRVLYVVVELDELDRVHACTGRDVFTFF